MAFCQEGLDLSGKSSKEKISLVLIRKCMVLGLILPCALLMSQLAHEENETALLNFFFFFFLRG